MQHANSPVKRRESHERSTFHGTYAWKRLRRIARIKANHTCQRCGRILIAGLHVHHVKALSRAPALRLEPLNLATVCPECHNAIEPRHGAVRLGGCNQRGEPTDPRHPWFTP